MSNVQNFQVDEAALARIPEGPEREELLQKLKGKQAIAEALAREKARQQARQEYGLRQNADDGFRGRADPGF